MALLLTAFAVPFSAIVTYKHRCGITNRRRFLAITAVSGSNLVTWMVSRYILGIDGSISAGKTLNLAVFMIVLTIFYMPLGAFRSFPATRSSDDGANKGA